MALQTLTRETGEGPVVRLGGEAGCGVLLICDHASNRLPERYGTLGLPESELRRHIAYDIGAAGVTRLMSEDLGAPAVMTDFCRLLIDPNRGADDPTLIMQISDGAVIPGNAVVTAEERQQRIERYYEPYHRAICAAIDDGIRAGRPPVILSVHSFTHEWRGVLRPWNAGVLWDSDPRLPKPLLDCLRRETEFTIGENEPYSGKLMGDSMWRHGTSRGLAHALVEIRQDQILDEEGQREWAGRLADIMRRILADEERATELARIHIDAR
jgi:predicted N-formylglutamate amidohydrolase